MTVSIEDLIVNAVVADLTAAFAETPEEEKPGLIRAGRLQENPVARRIALLVHLGDPDDDNWFSSLVSMKNGPDNSDMSIPTFEVGGGSMWWRRFTVEISQFGVKSKEDREAARRIVAAVGARVEHTLNRSARIPPLKDDFGEQCILVLALNTKIDEGGGPPNTFIWRGRTHFQVLTNRP